MNQLFLFRKEMTPIRKLLLMKMFAGGIPISEYTATGNPLSFNTNIAKPLKSLLIPWTPVQSGSGDPYPPGGGKNKFDATNVTIPQSSLWTASEGTLYQEKVSVNNASFIWNNQTFPAGTYTFSGEYSGTGTSGIRLLCSSSSSGGTWNASYNGYWISLTDNKYGTITVTESFSIGIVLLGATGHGNEPGTAYNLQFESGSSATSYAPYSNIRPISGVSALNVTRCGVNLFDKDAVTHGKYIKSDGTVLDTPSGYDWCITDYIPVVGNGKITYKNIGSTGAAPYSAWYTADKSLISTFKQSSAEETKSVPETAKYVRFSILNSSTNLKDFIVVLGESIGDYVAYTGNTIPVVFPALGKNLLDPSKTSVYGLDSSHYGLHVTFNDGSVTISGTSTSSGDNVAFNMLQYADASLSGKGYKVQLFDVVGTPVKSIYGLRFDNELNIAIIFDCSSSTEVNTTFKISVSEETLSSYEPFTNTVYGGSLDLTTGVLTATHGSVDLGSISFSGSTPENHVFRTGNNPIQNIKSQSSSTDLPYAICESYYPKAWSPISASDNGAFSIAIPSQGNKIVIIDHRFASTSDFESAVSGVKLVYELATAQTWQLTPQEVTSLLGDNVIWTDTNGSNTAVYLKKG